jgi:hypothetical protein
LREQVNPSARQFLAEQFAEWLGDSSRVRWDATAIMLQDYDTLPEEVRGRLETLAANVRRGMLRDAGAEAPSFLAADTPAALEVRLLALLCYGAQCNPPLRAAQVPLPRGFAPMVEKGRAWLEPVDALLADLSALPDELFEVFRERAAAWGAELRRPSDVAADDPRAYVAVIRSLLDLRNGYASRRGETRIEASALPPDAAREVVFASVALRLSAVGPDGDHPPQGRLASDLPWTVLAHHKLPAGAKDGFELELAEMRILKPLPRDAACRRELRDRCIDLVDRHLAGDPSVTLRRMEAACSVLLKIRDDEVVRRIRAWRLHPECPGHFSDDALTEHGLDPAQFGLPLRQN